MYKGPLIHSLLCSEFVELTLYYDISGVKLSWVKDGRHWTMGGTMQHSVVSSQVVNGHYTDGEAIEDELFVPHEYVRIQKK